MQQLSVSTSLLIYEHFPDCAVFLRKMYALRENPNKTDVSVFPLHRYAIMCGIMAEYDTVQNKIKNGYIFKVRYTHVL